MKNLCYVPMHPNESYFYGQINVFDARDGKAVKLIGHFAAPNVQEFAAARWSNFGRREWNALAGRHPGEQQ